MPSTITCPSCNVTLKPKTPVPAGTRIKCPKCQTVFVVPGDEEAVAPAPKPAAPRPTAANPPAPKPAPPPAEEEEVAEAADEADDAAAAGDPAPAAGRFKDKLKKVPMWGWIVGGVAALFLLCGCCCSPVGYISYYGTPGGGGGLLGGGNVNINMTTYKQLKKGMTEDEVKKVMGGAPSLEMDPGGGIHSQTWKGSGDDFITVGFLKGKSISGVYQFTNGAAKMSGGGELP